MDLTGQRIGDRYELLRLVGEGGMGQVYEARHLELDKRVAIKVLETELASDGDLRERFRREARITASLRHANIIEVMDFGLTSDGQPYIVMELLTGVSLADRLEREVRLPVADALRIMGQVLSGLAEAHSRGIVHRDLKPDNVFLDEERGRGQVVRLLDFGISKIYGAEKEDLQLTRTGTVMGTPYYMSPEQVMGSSELDARSDLYACGVMLYEMLTGRRPFEGATHNEVVVRIMSDEVPDPRAQCPDMGDDLAAALMRAMSRDRDARFGSAEEMARALGAPEPDLLTGSFSSVSVTSLPPRPAPRRAVWILPVVVLAALAFIALIVLVPTTIVLLRGCGGPDMVTITLRGVPDGASIVLDGTMMPADSLELPKGDDPVHFTVEADGYEPAAVDVIPTEDQQVRIVLEKRAKTKPQDTKDGADATGESGTSKTKSKKKSSNPFRKLVRKLKN